MRLLSTNKLLLPFAAVFLFFAMLACANSAQPHMLTNIPEELKERYIAIAKKHLFETRGWKEDEYTIYFYAIKTYRNAAWVNFDHNIAKKERAEIKEKYGDINFRYHNSEYVNSVIIDVIDESIVENSSAGVFKHAGQPCPIQEIPEEQRVKKSWRERYK